MDKYSKIQTIFKRDMAKKGEIILGKYSLPEFEYLKDNEWEFTEKVDGTNIRVHWNGSTVRFGGRTDNAQIPATLGAKLMDLFPAEKFTNFEEVTLYGEGYGVKIQKGGGNYKSDGVDFALFDVMIDGWWLKREDVEDISDKLEIGIVPVLGGGTLNDAVYMARKGFDSVWGAFPAEGLVLRPRVELKTRSGHRIITKIKLRDF